MQQQMYPRARLDTLTDGVFGVAMTLLVLDVRLPDDFQPRDTGELVQGLTGLMPKFLPYALSFGVLGLRWLWGIQVQAPADGLGREYVHWWLLYLLLITCFPFVTIVVGRFPDLPPSVWLYVGNTLLVSLVGARLLVLIPDLERGVRHDHQLLQIVLIASSGVALAWSFIDPSHALSAYVLGYVALVIIRWRRQSRQRTS